MDRPSTRLAEQRHRNRAMDALDGLADGAGPNGSGRSRPRRWNSCGREAVVARTSCRRPG
ncbi:MAG TPA: hypothetical protein VFW65_19040 [Pseudonocardiaceae bacterium]|nr:hypothetical protein [Pseudonocardiaceae bacterium]